MIRLVATFACTACLSACAGFPDWVVTPSSFSSSGTGFGQYSFNWSLSGDRQVAPLQVFDDGHTTWLQFLPGQPVPAIFLSSAGGEKILSYGRQGDYLVLDGIWPVLSFRGGNLIAQARRGLIDETSEKVQTPLKTAGSDVSSLAVHASPSVMTELQDVHDTASSSVEGVSDTTKESSTASAAAPRLKPAQTLVSRSDSTRLLTEASFVSDDSETAHGLPYDITLKDQNLRQTLSRWARQARWTFASEHWAVDVDIPVSGEAVFGSTFSSAVQELLSATELAERPLRPCFYSNRVLRVVPYAQSCDRSAGVREL